MDTLTELSAVILVGLLTTSSSMIGAAVGLYAPLSKRVLACILAFAAGSLMSALAIELAFKSAMELHHQGFNARSAWLFVAGGFACGAIVYFGASIFLEGKGAAVRHPGQFREYALARKHERTKELIGPLAQCDLLRHLPPDGIEEILPCVRKHELDAGSVVFRAGDPADALYIVAQGTVDVIADSPGNNSEAGAAIAQLGPGTAFGEMGLLGGGARTATVRTATNTTLLGIGRDDFNALIAADPVMARAVRRLSHERAIRNLSSGGPDASTWATVASESLEHISRVEANRMLREAGRGAGLAIVAHVMIPEAIHEGGSLVVLPTVAGFLLGLYLALGEAIG